MGVIGGDEGRAADVLEEAKFPKSKTRQWRIVEESEASIEAKFPKSPSKPPRSLAPTQKSDAIAPQIASSFTNAGLELGVTADPRDFVKGFTATTLIPCGD
ncbi:hypothetical protein CDL15_Pgr017358 [Punica granatum]|uniref:Uncharacterized protein n=1 Tax=Punica granatum TaxID=22663 RepID=A0A218Y2Z8_PUNGR|nr:hypothetical protein CDL15_Pgr017358 [Punica granatum]